MEKREPVIVANEFTNDELYAWMQEKLSAMRQLKALQAEKASMELRLAEITEEIRAIGLRSCIEVCRQRSGPILHQAGLGTLQSADLEQ
ncbi:Uncharacterised protein [Serratia liquefaciens]|nr:Uncharacterised protein [Serratia liquefaciens]CAI1123889.1 Uncharacterised protein [Serratia liquefaciens]